MSERDPFREFDRRLDAARAEGEAEKDSHAPSRNDFGPGMQAGIEVFGGTVAGVLVGWALDSWLGTGPVLLILFLFLGGAAGVRNAFRTLKRLVPDDEGR